MIRYFGVWPSVEVVNIDHVVIWGVDARLDGIGTTLTASWVHGLFMGDYDRQPLPDVFVLDLTARYRYRFTFGEREIGIEPYLNLRNLLDRRYAYVAGYSMPGFNGMLGLRLDI